MDIYFWDIAALIWLIVFLVMGFNRGLILTLGRMCITILSFAAGYGLAQTYSLQLALMLDPDLLEGTEGIALACSELFLFFVGFLVFRLLGRWLLRLLNRIAHLPVLHLLNRLGGALCGLVEGSILLMIAGQILVFIGLIPTEVLSNSTMLAKYFMAGFL